MAVHLPRSSMADMAVITNLDMLSRAHTTKATSSTAKHRRSTARETLAFPEVLAVPQTANAVSAPRSSEVQVVPSWVTN
jgi:hypothetical protein